MMKNESGQSSLEFVMMLTLAMIVVMLAAILVNAKFIQSASLISEEVRIATDNISAIEGKAHGKGVQTAGPEAINFFFGLNPESL